MTTLGAFVRTDMPRPTVEAVARAAEEGGYGALWVNNPPGQDGLTPVAWAAAVTRTIRLGTGVVPMSDHTPAEVLARVRSLDLPLDRYRLGVGSGRLPHAADRVRAALRELRPETAAELTVGALGPRVCAVAGEEADSLLLNAVNPEEARRSGDVARAAAAAAGRPAPRIYVVVLAGLGDAGGAALDQVGRFYASMPAYAAHFARTGLTPADGSIAAADLDDLGERLAAWRGAVDELVVSLMPGPQSAEEAVEHVRLVGSAWAA
jgi:alkanesulfonate monooxygenase SsuD/methylene tetrahydromethanopterin reductase-like flavin-dependent oxidoreductase (luciferase family)